MLIGIGPICYKNASYWSKSVEGTLPYQSVTSKWQQTLDGSSDTLSKHWSGSVITPWSFGLKLGVMMGRGMENIKLHKVGAVAHLSKLGGGSWSVTRGSWCGSK